MKNPLTEYPVLVAAAAITGGLLVRRALAGRTTQAPPPTERYAPGPYTPEEYAYYLSATPTPRTIAGNGIEASYVTTDMLSNAMRDLYDKVLAEVDYRYGAQLVTVEQYYGLLGIQGVPTAAGWGDRGIEPPRYTE